MNTEDSPSLDIRGWLLALSQHDQSARRHLVEYAEVRYQTLARKMLRSEFGRVGRWVETGDVLQGAMMRLWRALEGYVPPSELVFRRLVARELRHELIDLARKHFGPCGVGRNLESASGDLPSRSAATPSGPDTSDPHRLAEWTEFHEHASRLTEKLRDVFDLRYYHGLRVEDAAKQLGISEATVKLRWAQALCQLRVALNGNALPES